MRYLTALVLTLAANSVVAATCDTAGRFTVNADDGTVTDSSTGLTWKRCLEGQTFSSGNCNNTATKYTWSQALALTSGGWRVPNIKELQSIVDETKVNPAIDTACFPTPAGTANIYVWSASPYAGNTAQSWLINFKDGLFFYNLPQSTTGIVSVRLVKP